jgi:SpoVK/Ycf46/Vps4 family AAA+-type ATPase
MPDRTEIASILDSVLEYSVSPEVRKTAAPNGTRDAAIDAAVGLSGEEAQACYAKSLVQHKRIEPATVAGEKRRIIAREKVLEYFEPLAGGLDAVGGLDNVKTWLKARSAAYTPAARAYGLPAPKGIFVFGISGCGKTMIGKAAAANWGCPLLRLDMGALRSKFVGESEANLRKAFKTIEALGRCVILVDEIEKAMQGATSGSSDGGVSADALGAFLSWMQDRTCEAFVIATANEVEALPPELLRKGRFDEMFFVDLPNEQERAEIITASLRAFGRSGDAKYLPGVVDATTGFTGSEIAALVPDALFAAFADGGREVEAADLLSAAKTVTPLSVTAAEKIDRLRKWGATRGRRASTAVVTAPKAPGPARRLDI